MGADNQNLPHPSRRGGSQDVYQGLAFPEMKDILPSLDHKRETARLSLTPPCRRKGA